MDLHIRKTMGQPVRTGLAVGCFVGYKYEPNQVFRSSVDGQPGRPGQKGSALCISLLHLRVGCSTLWGGGWGWGGGQGREGGGLVIGF